MLNTRDNELMCRVGPNTPMGELMRQYWTPALLPSEVPEADGPPVRLRLLGEDLIAFRTTSGAVGLIQNACPHRGASMFFGRNEEEGLRCVYHGWRFDVTGACVDMPSEPAESNFKNKVRTRAYPTVERNGMIWAYMGPREVPPPLPALAPNLEPTCRVTKYLNECNYMQALEGAVDTVHQTFLHSGHVMPEDTLKGSNDYYTTMTRWMNIEVRDIEGGATYAGIRPVPEDDTKQYYRIGHFLAPFYTFPVPGLLGRKNSAIAWVPVDDENTMQINFNVPVPGMQDPYFEGIGGLLNGVPRPQPLSRFDPFGTTRPQASTDLSVLFLPETSDWLGRFRSKANKDNDYCIDRELQARMGTWSGMPNVAEDPMVCETMGAIYDRTQEHMATTDAMIIRTRRIMIKLAQDLKDKGEIPVGVDKPELYNMYCGSAIVPAHVDGIDATLDIQFGRAKDIDPEKLAITPETT